MKTMFEAGVWFSSEQASVKKGTKQINVLDRYGRAIREVRVDVWED